MKPAGQFLNNLQRFRLVTFDITDTLLRLKDPAEQYTKTAREFGVSDIDEQRLQQCFKQQFKTMTKNHPNFGCHTPGMSWQDWWIELVSNVFRCVQSDISKQQLQNIAEKLLCVYRTRDCWSHIAGSIDFVERVRVAGKRVGVISNFDPSLKDVLKEMNLLEKFDFVLTSYDAGVEKPNTEIFQIPLREMKINTSEALHIGNKYAVDYLGARNSGWSSLLVRRPGEPAGNEVNVTHLYASLVEMISALETTTIQW